MFENILAWIKKTFGEFRGGELFEFVDKYSIKGDFLIEDLNLVFQARRANLPIFSPEWAKTWKRELNEITENSIVQFRAEYSETLQGQAILNSSKSILLSLIILYRRRI